MFEFSLLLIVAILEDLEIHAPFARTEHGKWPILIENKGAE